MSDDKSTEKRVWQNISDAKSWVIPEFHTESSAQASSAVEDEIEPAPPTAAELHELQQRAYNEAFAQGRAEGLKAGQQAIDEAVQRLKIIAAELASPLEELDRDLEYCLSNLALILARRIIGKAVHEDRDSLHSLVVNTVAALGHELESPVDVYLSPQDFTLLKQYTDAAVPWVLHQDAQLQPGDLRVRRGLAEIDARLQQRLDRLAAEMLSA